MKNNNIKRFIEFLKNNHYTNEITENDNGLTVGGYLYLRGTEIKELPEGLTVGGYLYLSETKIKELPEGLTVGGYLDLRGTEIKELPEGLTVGEDLYLSETKIKELPEGLTVGGGLYLSGTEITNTSKVKKLKTGYCKERKYIYFDGILWGNVKSIKKIDGIAIYKTPLGYCVEENGLTAHGEILKEAIEDLTLKKLENTNIDEIVKQIKQTGKVTRIQYREITGASRLGTNNFCIRNNIQDLEEIELTELRKILKDDYGAEKFWNLIDNKNN